MSRTKLPTYYKKLSGEANLYLCLEGKLPEKDMSPERYWALDSYLFRNVKNRIDLKLIKGWFGIGQRRQTADELRYQYSLSKNKLARRIIAVLDSLREVLWRFPRYIFNGKRINLPRKSPIRMDLRDVSRGGMNEYRYGMRCPRQRHPCRSCA